MEPFTCGALVELVLPKDKVLAERQEDIGIVCNRIDELVRESIHGGNLSAAALEDCVRISFTFGVFDTSDARKAWAIVSANANKIIIEPVDDSILRMNIYLPYEKVNNDGVIEDKLLASNRAKMFRELLKEFSKRGISSEKLDTDVLEEIAEEYAVLENCIDTSYISMEVDETFDTMINMEMSGASIVINNPPAVARVHQGNWGFNFYPALCSTVVAESTFAGYLDLEDLLK